MKINSSDDALKKNYIQEYQALNRQAPLKFSANLVNELLDLDSLYQI